MTIATLNIDIAYVEATDSMLTDDFLFMAYSNNSYHLYYLDFSQSDYPIAFENGMLAPSNAGSPVQQLIEWDTNEFRLVYAPNPSSGDNYLYIYALTKIYDANDNLINMSFDQISSVNIRDFEVTYLTLNTEFLVMSCTGCAGLYGEVQVRDAATGTKTLYEFTGNDDVYAYGVDLLIQEHVNYTYIFISSRELAEELQGKYYISALTAIKAMNGQDWEFTFEQQAIYQEAAGLEKRGISMALVGDDVIFKYYKQQQIYRFKSCQFDQYVSGTECTACLEDKWTFSFQGTQCLFCPEVEETILPNDDTYTPQYDRVCIEEVVVEPPVDPDPEPEPETEVEEPIDEETVIEEPEEEDEGGFDALKLLPLMFVGLVILVIIGGVLVWYFGIREPSPTSDPKTHKKEEEDDFDDVITMNRAASTTPVGSMKYKNVPATTIRTEQEGAGTTPDVVNEVDDIEAENRRPGGVTRGTRPDYNLKQRNLMIVDIEEKKAPKNGFYDSESEDGGVPEEENDTHKSGLQKDGILKASISSTKYTTPTNIPGDVPFEKV